MNKTFKFGITIFALGFLGVLSLLLTDIPFDEMPIPEDAIQEIKEIPVGVLKLLMLINPTILLIVASVLGTVFYKKVHLKAPIIEGLVNGTPIVKPFKDLKFGIIGGLIAGLGMMLLMYSFINYLPPEYLALGEKFQPHLLTRFFYGGITEEILMRFGFMTFSVWLIFKITGSLKASVYWIGIILAALLFALGHLPILFVFIQDPTPALFVFIISANAFGGLVFGWIYWKKGLEMAIVAHIFAHVAMLSTEFLIR